MPGSVVGVVDAEPATGATPTVSQAWRTASACSPAAATVAAANPAKSVVAPTWPPVRAAYQIAPAPSHDRPPMAVAARWKARLGMPELRCTPPLSSFVSTYSSIEAPCGSLPSRGSS